MSNANLNQLKSQLIIVMVDYFEKSTITRVQNDVSRLLKSAAVKPLA